MHPTATSRRSFTIALAPSPEALRRVIGACARRRLAIIHLRYARCGPGGAGAAELCLEGPPARLAAADAWLGALVEVEAVVDAGIGAVAAA